MMVKISNGTIGIGILLVGAYLGLLLSFYWLAHQPPLLGEKPFMGCACGLEVTSDPEASTVAEKLQHAGGYRKFQATLYSTDLQGSEANIQPAGKNIFAE